MEWRLPGLCTHESCMLVAEGSVPHLADQPSGCPTVVAKAKSPLKIRLAASGSLVASGSGVGRPARVVLGEFQAPFHPGVAHRLLLKRPYHSDE